MSDAPDKESQTEEATEKKLHDSIEKGDTPFSREAALFASLLASLLFLSFFLRDGAVRLIAALQNLLDQSGQYQLGQGRNATLLLGAVVEDSGAFVAPALILLIVAGVVAAVAQNPPRLIGERIAPKWDRVSPRSGWGRIFSLRGATEFGKSLLKLFAVGLVVTIIVKGEIGGAFKSIFSDPAELADHLLDVVRGLFASVAAAAGALAAADLVWSRIHWRRDLRMTRQEVKEEQKQMLGDPMVKARLRSVALERSRKRMMSAVPSATLVVANPTHYAIALRYVRDEGGAPKVVAKGQDLIALKIREIAEANAIPVIEDKALARSMYDRVEVDMMIPAEFYRAIAEIIHFLNTRGSGRRNP
ncbi:flagellar type III secretion system protein FlhB [Rhodoblastus acidophilus]|uniref:Flagellar type III secretion system protein FlhB n=1 Tax=Candidatus Rhodoblastus alkanivorans TaxID=2954117 RepID=A0ABS9Z3F2_9HYPH|nr:EscU/YscU/HrcU family type III secretion system export apparatus switch protein [Candidatus Rhodoblastus alkanivorans]MCI4678806.1 flagellar type III secretion system protein FlhB [Candidatus Rhodoblastus alkanivorans]MCI4682195.1 flagellar type III secretion system protein FlhB [Candidatus Rhodoblastus alkanivorans]MDI4639497.1 flagellar type III secretion system protein FlhB [Rhodoblastus acidophilus]